MRRGILDGLEQLLDRAVQRRFDVLALVACDADYVPLVRKIKFAGNKKLSKGKLSDEVTIKEKDPLDRVKLRTDEE